MRTRKTGRPGAVSYGIRDVTGFSRGAEFLMTAGGFELVINAEIQLRAECLVMRLDNLKTR